MVASIGQMASAEYYLESQRSFRHPNEYYTAGEEPDGTWFNPEGVCSTWRTASRWTPATFSASTTASLPTGRASCVQRAGNPDRSPGVDMTFSVRQERVGSVGDF